MTLHHPKSKPVRKSAPRGNHFAADTAATRPSRISRRAVITLAAALVWLALLALPFTRTLAMQLIGLVAFWAIVAALIAPTGVWRTALGLRGARAALAVTCVLFVAFSWWYLSQYDFIPVWDEVDYWRNTLHFNEIIATSPIEALYSLVLSIMYYNYNYLQCWVMALPVSIFGTWEGAMFSVVVLFNLPAALMLALFVASRLEGVCAGAFEQKGTVRSKNAGANAGSHASAREGAHGRAVAAHRSPGATAPAPEDTRAGSRAQGIIVVALFICALCVPALLHPTFDGFMDAPAYVLLIAVLAALFDQSLTRSVPRALLIGIGICGTFLLRRYFFYSVVGLAVGCLVFWLIHLVILPADERKNLFMKLLRALGVIVAAFAVVALAFPSFIYRSLFGGQESAYQAYTRLSSLADRLAEIAGSIGWIWIALAAVAIIALAVLRASKRIRLDQLGATWVACLLSCVVALALFWRVQDLGMQHWFIFGAMLLVVLLAPVAALIEVLASETVAPFAASLLSGVLCVLSVIGLVNGFSLTPALASAAPLSNALPAVAQHVHIDTDNDERRAFTQRLIELTGGTETVYYAAASWDVNSTLASSVVLPGMTEQPFPYADADVDLRDGFDTQFFDARFVVATDPVQTHLASGSEQIVETLNELVQDPASYIGVHYQLVDTFEFAGNISVRIYERISDYSQDDVERLATYFDGIYPDNPDLFRDRFDAYLAKRWG